MKRVRRLWFIGICENEDIAAENSGNDTMMIDDDDDDAHCVDLIESEAVTNEGQDGRIAYYMPRLNAMMPLQENSFQVYSQEYKVLRHTLEAVVFPFARVEWLCIVYVAIPEYI